MSLTDRVERRVLTLDIETSPDIIYHFGLRTQGKFISPKKIIENGRMICFGAKWLDRKTVMVSDEYHDTHEGMVKKAWDLLDEADILVTYNGIGFDNGWLRTEFALAGLPHPRPWKDVDLIRTARSRFRFASNSLDHITGRLQVGDKMSAGVDFDLWKGFLAGDEKAIALMRRYCGNDVKITEALYLRLLPWIVNHPPVRIGKMGEKLCNRCGSADLLRLGNTLAVVIEYALYRCEDCEGLSRAGHIAKVSNTRAV